MYCAALARVSVSKIFRAHRHWNNEMLKLFEKTEIFFSRNFGAKSGGKCSLYRAVRALLGPGPWGFSLTNLMDDPALIVNYYFFALGLCLLPKNKVKIIRGLKHETWNQKLEWLQVRLFVGKSKLYSDSEKSLKIGQYLTKLRRTKMVSIFLDHPVYYRGL